MTKTDRAAFNWQDPLLLDDQLTDEERAVQATTRSYARDKLFSRILDANRHERFDVEIVRRLI
mgnify:CR=1 FL=1